MIRLTSIEEKRQLAETQLSPLSLSERLGLSVTDLKVGGYLKLRDENWKVLRIGSYLKACWDDFSKHKKTEWTYELTLFSLKTGSVNYLEYFVDNDLKMVFTDSEINHKDLIFNGKSLELDTLMEISDGDVRDAYFEGRAFEYSKEKTSAAQYFKDFENGNNPDYVRLYEFVAGDGTCLTVECRFVEQTENKCEINAYLSSPVNSTDVEILQVGNI